MPSVVEYWRYDYTIPRGEKTPPRKGASRGYCKMQLYICFSKLFQRNIPPLKFGEGLKDGSREPGPERS
jgi:hypothetical protein